MAFNLSFADNAILSCLFLFFLIIEFKPFTSYVYGTNF